MTEQNLWRLLARHSPQLRVCNMHRREGGEGVKKRLRATQQLNKGCAIRAEQQLNKALLG